MRVIIINGIIGAMFGLCLDKMGYGLGTYEYWIMIGFFIAAIANSLCSDLGGR